MNKYIVRKSTVYLYLIIIVLFISPSTRILGLENTSSYNLPFATLISFFLPLFCLSFFFNKNLLYFITKYGVYQILLILTLVSASLLRYLGGVQVEVFSYRFFLLTILTFIFQTVLFYALSMKLSFSQFSKIFSNSLYILLLFSSILGIGAYLGLENIVYIHETFYNWRFETDGQTDFLLAVSKLNDEGSYRSFAVFSGSNQFGIFASICMILMFLFQEMKILNPILFYFSFFLEFGILVASQSRTALIIYFVLFLILLIKKESLKFFLKFPIVIPILIFSIPYLGDRLLLSFSSSNNLVELGEQQRVFFWALFWEKLLTTPSLLLMGLPEVNSNIASETNYFESGILNIISRGGILSFLLYISIIVIPIKWINKAKNINPKVVFYLKLSFWTFVLMEVSGGNWLSFRIDTVNALMIILSLKLVNEK